MPNSTPDPAAKQRGRQSITDASVSATGFAWVVGRWQRFLVIGLWLLAFALTIGLNLPGKFADAETNSNRNYLPSDAESTLAATAIEDIQQAENAPLVAVVRREGGLTPEDLRVIRRELDEFNATSANEQLRVVPDDGEAKTVTLRDVVRGENGWIAGPQISEDGTTALLLGAVRATGDSERLFDAVDVIRGGAFDGIEDDTGLEVLITGGAGFGYDAIKVFSNLNASLFLAALSLVIVLLIIIYRSPVLLFLPLTAVIFAEVLSRGVAYLTTDLGVTVTGQSSSILSVLVLGAGTDYALLIVSRYREELRHHENRHDALRLAMQSAGPAVFASGLTVVAGLLTLTVASVEGTAGLGPIGAIGVAVAMLAMITLLPAMFAVLPRGVFWPKVPHYGDAGADATQGAWRRVGERIARRPRRTWVITALGLIVCIGGLATFNPNLSQNDTFIGEVESVKGSETLALAFPSGSTGPVQIVVPDEARAEGVVSDLTAIDEVDSARVVAQGEPGTLVEATLTADPFSIEGQNAIPAVREAARGAGGGEQVLVGGDTAINYDLAKANDRDLKLIIPIVLGVVLLILIGLLRAVTLPLILIGTVVLSFAAALGISSVLWTQVFGFAGADRSIIIFAFVFLVALGIDYNIFLASRIREEALRHGTREGILRGLAATGGVITAAGIVLAGTFLVLATTPVVFLVETGSAIAIGVLLDTFIVRSILTPAISLDAGRKIWWPWASRIPEDDA